MTAADEPSADNWYEFVDLTPAMVGLLRYGELSTEEKESMRHAFAQYKGEDRIPSAPAVPPDVQDMLGILYPEYRVPTEPLQTLFILLGMDSLAADVELPGSGEANARLAESVDATTKRVLDYEEQGNDQDKLRLALTGLYQAVSGELYGDIPKLASGSQADVIIGLGARRDATVARARKAAEIYLSCARPDESRIMLSGYHPYYAVNYEFGKHDYVADAGYLPFGEAEAMAVTVENWIPGILAASLPGANGARLPKLVIDPRARNTLETIVHSLPIIYETRAALGRPIAICFVTSPYHVRRTHALADVQYSHFLHYKDTIGEIYCEAAPTRMSHAALVTPNDVDHKYAVSLYIRESIKLIGGRITGEF